jgi:hypothetical protein
MIRNNGEQHDRQRRYSDTEESVIRFQQTFFGDDVEISRINQYNRDENIMNQKTRCSSDQSFFLGRSNKRRCTMDIPKAPSTHHIEAACAEGYAKYFEPVDTDLVTKSQHGRVDCTYISQPRLPFHCTTHEATLDRSNSPCQGQQLDHRTTLMAQHEQNSLLSTLSFEEQKEIATVINESLASTDIKASGPNHSKDQIPSDIRSSSPSISPVSQAQSTRFKPFHERKWNEQLEELRDFKRKYGNCLVPHTFDENPHLARWVKRQRRQYKLMIEGNAASTMTQERAEILTKEGFIWDSHEVVWMERYNQLVSFMSIHGHCRVPMQSSEFPQLFSWIKCQRRQYKLFKEGKPSSLSHERMRLLNSIGFTWEVRTLVEKRSNSVPDIAGSK